MHRLASGVIVAVSALVLGAGGVRAQPAAECGGWQDCRDQALEAEAAGEFERFHDLAWRAMQQRGRLDPDVMIVLARAQARSGRPHDALVMLRRIIELGVLPVGARAEAAFERTRRLPGWAEVNQLIGGAAPAGEPPAVASAPAAAARAAAVDADPPSVTPGAGAGLGPAGASPSSEEVVRFRAPNLVPSGLAYDAASARFLFGNRHARTVVTISERLDAAVDLVRSASAGFHDVFALAIDARRGDLWVASAEAGGGSGSPAAALHKLQLVSGRPLGTIPIETDDRAPRFTALAVDAAGAVYALDGAESRLWRLAPGAKQPMLVAEPELSAPAAMALDSGSRRAYIAHADGLSRLSLADEGIAAVDGPEEAGLAAIESLAWHRGSLLAVVRMADTPRRLVRLRLNRAGTTVTGAETLDPEVATCRGAGAISVSGDDVYYLAGDPGERLAQDCAIVVRKLTLR